MSGTDTFSKAIVAGSAYGRRYIVKFFEEGSYLKNWKKTGRSSLASLDENVRQH